MIKPFHSLRTEGLGTQIKLLTEVPLTIQLKAKQEVAVK